MLRIIVVAMLVFGLSFAIVGCKAKEPESLPAVSPDYGKKKVGDAEKKAGEAEKKAGEGEKKAGEGEKKAE
jgi:hypothetical protein